MKDSMIFQGFLERYCKWKTSKNFQEDSRGSVNARLYIYLVLAILAFVFLTFFFGLSGVGVFIAAGFLINLLVILWVFGNVTSLNILRFLVHKNKNPKVADDFYLMLSSDSEVPAYIKKEIALMLESSGELYWESVFRFLDTLKEYEKKSEIKSETKNPGANKLLEFIDE